MHYPKIIGLNNIEKITPRPIYIISLIFSDTLAFGLGQDTLN